MKIRNKSQICLFEEPLNVKQSFDGVCRAFSCENRTPAWTDVFGGNLSRFLSSNNRRISTLSLFSGAGGLDIGFNDALFDIVESVEIERKFCDTLEANTRGNVRCVDIKEYSSAHLPPIDFIIGGPPCQTFSAAGRRANGVMGTDDARGTLFLEYVRLLGELSPEGFLFENVYGITGAQNGEAWSDILKGFSSVGYKLFYRVLDAADYGVPQHRERLFIVGLKESEGKSFKFPRPTHGPDSPDMAEYYVAGQAVSSVELAEKELITGINGRFGHLINEIPPGLNYSFYTEEMGHPNPVFAWRSKFSDFMYKADPLAPVRTVKAQGGQYTGPLHWDNRYFAVSEFKRLQTFPDNYEIRGNRQTQIHQIGNSVPPQIARILAMAIRNQVFNTEFPFEIPYLEDDEQLGFRKRKRLLTERYQSKARKAIINSNVVELPRDLNSYIYGADILPNFDYRKSENGKYIVRVEWSDKLKIDVMNSNDAEAYKNSSPLFVVSVAPNECSWNIGANAIEANCFTSQPLAYTVVWKAIEQELINNSIKADLVQLCGYYQYVPKIKCSLSSSSKDRLFGVLKNVVNGSPVRRLLTEEEMSSLLEIQSSEIMNFAEKLRELGYEIRNNGTNPQIKQGQWLIPYAFPTLTPLSVQLRKKLR